MLALALATVAVRMVPTDSAITAMIFLISLPRNARYVRYPPL